MSGPAPASGSPGDARPFDARSEARRLLRTVRAGALATLGPDGMPFASLTAVATAVDGRPLLLLSRLAAHTGHLDRDGRCSLLLAQGGKGDPLAHPRLTVTGRAAPVAPDEADAARDRYLRRQPKAALYADFPDFRFFRLDPEGAHLNGGFARAATLSGADLLSEPGALAASEAGAVAHMNADHRDALALYGERLAGAGAGPWLCSGLDPDGIDLVCGDRVARLAFAAPVHDGPSLRAALVAMAAAARAMGPHDGPGEP